MTQDEIIQRVADAADKEGLNVIDFVTSPKLLKRHKIKQADLTARIVDQAQSYHAKQMRSLVDRYEPKKENVMTTKTKETTQSKGRLTVFDKPVTGVIRWMGSKNWTFQEAKYVLGQLTEVADGTIRTQLSRVRQGKGDPAKLKREEQKELNGLRREFKEQEEN